MKRLFVILSNLLVSLFLVWVVTIWSDTYVSHFYPSVSVFDGASRVRFDELAASLTTLAEETDSFLAIQHQDATSDGHTAFSYTTFGKGSLPEGLAEKLLEQAKNSGMETNYFIFNGTLDIEILKEELSKLGFTNLAVTTPSSLNVLASVFSNGFQVIALLIFFLTFGALSLIRQIKTLRTAGIRLISGEYRWKIFLRPLGQDLVNALIGLVLGFLAALILKSFVAFSWVTFQMILCGLAMYNLFLLFIALFFACLFTVGIKKIHLMQVIKGQVPVRGILSLVLIGQLLAVVIVSLGLSRATMYAQAWRQQEQGETAWRMEKELTTVTIGREGATPGFDAESIKKQQAWFQLIQQAVSEQGAMLSRHYLVEQRLKDGFATVTNLSQEQISRDYSPEGNVVIVTPQYLKRQQVAVSSDVEEKLSQLATGEFILLLPSTLQSEESYYTSLFEEELTNQMSSQDTRQKMVATVSYLPAGKNRFVYNTTPISYQQFLIDPIIIVVTPHSTREQSFNFWVEALQGYLLFDNLEDTQSLTKARGLENWVGEFQTGYSLYKSLLNNIQREVWTMLLGAVLGILTAILMFHTMNRLYFEEFRRDILIKRIAGLYFLEIHRTYLLAQLSIFFVGFLISIFLSTNSFLAFLVLLLFIGISILQLHIQAKRENQMSLLILKGA